MGKVFSSLGIIADSTTTLVQMIAFSDPKNQLPRYLRTMENAGFSEVKFFSNTSTEKRVWRTVPNRKWYASLQGNTPSSKEVVLIHRKN